VTSFHNLASSWALSPADRKAYLEAMAKDARRKAGRQAVRDAKQLAKELDQ
jgi:hypothetical protein